MNQPDLTSGEQAIVEKILADGRSQAKRIIDSANRTAMAERSRAEAEAERIRAAIVEEGARKADAIRTKQLAIARIQARRLLLKAREDVIEIAFRDIEERLDQLRGEEKYRKVLVRLAQEAVAALGSQEVVLTVSKRDERFIDAGFLAEVRTGVDNITPELTLSVEFDPHLEDGGCIAKSARGRVLFDNTFKRRLERMKPSLRSMITRELLGRDD